MGDREDYQVAETREKAQIDRKSADVQPRHPTGVRCGAAAQEFPVKVHILEDDPGVNESLRYLLQALNHTVLSYRDAISFFDAAPPGADELVIVDLGLPHIDGTNVIRWLKRLSPAPRILAISGQSQRGIERALAGIAHVSILRKPLDGDSIVSMLS